MPQLSIHTPVGDLTLSEEDGALVAVDWGWGRDQTPTPGLLRAAAQMHEYFDGQRPDFDLRLRPAGSLYQTRVWAEAGRIPCGVTWTYAHLAARAGGSARAVGAALAANPLPILVPCHRVVATSGPGGYSGGDGLATKRALLALERLATDRQAGARTVGDRPRTRETSP